MKFGSVSVKGGRFIVVFGGKQEGRRLDSFYEIDVQAKTTGLINGIKLSKPKSGFGFVAISGK